MTTLGPPPFVATPLAPTPPLSEPQPADFPPPPPIAIVRVRDRMKPLATQPEPAHRRPASGAPDRRHLAWAGRLGTAALVLLLLGLAVPHTPPGICSHDGGDLQVCAATLGIAHPPGYCIYVSLGHLLTRTAAVLGVDAARAVSLGCLAAGVLAVTLAVLVQIRLGAGFFIAAASALLLASHLYLWQNLVTPEVYAPSLALLGGATWLVCGFTTDGRTWRLFLAAVLLGAAAVSRPPLTLVAGGLMLSLTLILRTRRTGRRRTAMLVTLAAAGLLMPAAYSTAYLWLRDTPGTTCNYVERYHAVTGLLPATDAGAGAKARRIVWLVTGRQYRALVSIGGADLPERAAWIVNRLAPRHPPLLARAIVLALVGGVSVWRREPAVAILLLAIAAAAGVFLLVYRVSDDAADMLPLMWVLAVLAGVGAGRLLAAGLGRRRRVAAAGVCLLATGWAVLRVRAMPDFAARADATVFVARVDAATLPRDALIFTDWGFTAPLLYAQQVLAQRNDLGIVTADKSQWLKLVRRYARAHGGESRPVFLLRRVVVPPGHRLRRDHNLWRLERVKTPTSNPAGGGRSPRAG